MAVIGTLLILMNICLSISCRENYTKALRLMNSYGYYPSLEENGQVFTEAEKKELLEVFAA